MTLKDKVDAFLAENRIDADSISFDNVLSFFLSEMKNGLDGKKSSLPMIPTYQGIGEEIEDGAKAVVLDLGGTNFRTCLVTFRKGEDPVVSDFRNVPMPGSEGEIDKDTFYSVLADNISRLLPFSSSIGLCFSYPATSLENHDAVVNEFAKEVKAPSVEGTQIGSSLLAKLREKGHDTSSCKISVVNDTVATLLAAKARYPQNVSSYLGFILGTGLNIAYIEDVRNIRKIGQKGSNMIINTESGCLDIALGPLDEAFWKMTENPLSHRLEKAVSGAYQGHLAEFVIKEAMKKGLFSKEFSERFSTVSPLSTKEMSRYIEMPFNNDYALPAIVGSDDDAYVLYRIIDSIIERAGKLAAINISAAVLASDSGKDPRRPVVINIDGTTYYKTANLENYTEYYLYKHLTKERGRYFKCVKIDQSPILGAAIAGCMN